MYKCSTMRPGNPFVSVSKDQRSMSHRLCRSSNRMQYCRCCVCKPCWVFPAAVPSTPGFPCVISPRPLAAGRLVFSGVGFFHSCECRLLLITIVLKGIKRRLLLLSLRQVASDILKKLPPVFDMDKTRKMFGISISPTTVVLLQASHIPPLSCTARWFTRYARSLKIRASFVAQ